MSRRRSPIAAVTALAAIALGGCGAPVSGASPGPDAAAAPPWATYTIPAGAHTATLTGRTPKDPIDGVTDATGRDYQLALDGSARYVIVDPTQPDDQLDWNKLPGVSDCGTIDLSQAGAMFGWRWRVDLDPPVLEITAYANDAAVHLTAPAPLAALDADDLGAATPLHYRLWREAAQYRFELSGTIRGRPIHASATLPRGCAGAALDVSAWASSLYFGGTSVAPHAITARISERAFAPD